jgi:hypothetical protein
VNLSGGETSKNPKQEAAHHYRATAGTRRCGWILVSGGFAPRQRPKPRVAELQRIDDNQ